MGFSWPHQTDGAERRQRDVAGCPEIVATRWDKDLLIPRRNCPSPRLDALGQHTSKRPVETSFSERELLNASGNLAGSSVRTTSPLPPKTSNQGLYEI